jgi:probable rRNA maturation factor
MAATVVSQQTSVPGAKAACKRAAEAVLGTRKVIVALIDDETMAGLHERFLGKKGPTDVLSFPHGEIVVSADTARREAEARGIKPIDELVLYVVHGALHLDGYDDRTPSQREEMRRAERRVLTGLGLDDVFGAEAKPRPRRKTSARARKQAKRARARKRKKS